MSVQNIPRVLRGGGWFNYGAAGSCWRRVQPAAYRYWFDPRVKDVGFRGVL